VLRKETIKGRDITWAAYRKQKKEKRCKKKVSTAKDGGKVPYTLIKRLNEGGKAYVLVGERFQRKEESPRGKEKDAIWRENVRLRPGGELSQKEKTVAKYDRRCETKKEAKTRITRVGRAMTERG